MTYHPLTVRALRLYQDAAKARFARIPDADADADYSSAVEFSTAEGMRNPVVALRAYTRTRCGELLAKARAIRSAMRCGNWQGENGPLDLAAVQGALLQRREDRRAMVAAEARAAAPAPAPVAMVAQPVQQAQANAGNPRGTVAVSNEAYRAMIAARDSGRVSFPDGILERAFYHSHLTRAQWQDVCRRMRADAPAPTAPAMIPQPCQQAQARARSAFDYSSWRHGGWYVHNVRYPNGAIGCVSRNYEDGKWRIVCDPRPNAHQLHTYRTRDEAARAELALVATLPARA